MYFAELVFSGFLMVWGFMVGWLKLFSPQWQIQIQLLSVAILAFSV
jgi:low affinity Fe/Cu permease